MTLLTASASRLGGGVASALHSHAAMLREAGADVTVVALADQPRAMSCPDLLLSARLVDAAQK